MKTIVIVSGGFDPVHSGHIRLIKEARLLGDQLIVGINSDEWLARKKGRAFMPWQERLCVLNNLRQVDEVYTFDDEDGTACHLLQQVRDGTGGTRLETRNDDSWFYREKDDGVLSEGR